MTMSWNAKTSFLRVQFLERLIKEYYVNVYAITLQLLAKKDEYRMSAAESVTSDRNDNTYKDGGQ